MGWKNFRGKKLNNTVNRKKTGAKAKEGKLQGDLGGREEEIIRKIRKIEWWKWRESEYKEKTGRFKK